MAKTTLVLKEPNAEVETPIYLFLRYKDKRARITTKISVHPDHWDSKRRQIKNVTGVPNNRTLNARLKEYEEIALTLFDEFVEANKYRPQPKQIKAVIERALFEPEKETAIIKDFWDYVHHFIRRKEQLGTVGRDRIRKYKLAVDNLKHFERQTKQTLTFDSFDLHFATDYHVFLAEEYGNTQNTINDKFRVLKTFLNGSLNEGYHNNKKHRLLDFTPREIETEELALTYDELKQFYQLDLSKRPALARTRDLFLVGCYTGLRFSDFTRLKPKHINANSIVIKQQKQDERVDVPILFSELKTILKRYNNDIASLKISPQKFNENIKVIAKQVAALHRPFVKKGRFNGQETTSTIQAWEDVSAHTGRRTFCTLMYKMDYPASTIMAISGHKTEKDFYRYIRLPKKDQSKRMAEMFEANFHKISNHNLKVV